MISSVCLILFVKNLWIRIAGLEWEPQTPGGFEQSWISGPTGRTFGICPWKPGTLVVSQTRMLALKVDLNKAFLGEAGSMHLALGPPGHTRIHHSGTLKRL